MSVEQVQNKNIGLQRDALREEIIKLIREERSDQIEKYGTNDGSALGFGRGSVAHPWLMPFSDDSAKSVCEAFRDDYERHEATGEPPTWMHLIREEVSELFEAEDQDDIVTEAVQVAALCIALVEHVMIYGGLDLNISTRNLSMLLQAYEDGEGGNLDYADVGDGWIEGSYDDFAIYLGKEVDGVLYSICSESNQRFGVYVGDALNDGAAAAVFHTAVEAKAYVKGLVAK